MSRIAVIGAGGYVGPFVCRALRDAGHEVLAIGRPHAVIALSGLRVPVVADIRDAGACDVVVNLAYPTSGSVYEVPRQNQRLLEQMRVVGDRGGRVIHVSTLAVFGYTLDTPPYPGPVAPRRDFLYIESKVDLERRVAKAFGSADAHVVRLGNVWGPGSPNWTAALAHGLLFGMPVGVAGEDGYSNVTDVANVASYVTALVAAPATRRLTYHHLAELSALRWSHWLGKLAAELGVEPVRAPARVGIPQALWPEVREAVRPGSPLAVYRRFVYGRYTGSWLRSVVRMLPVSLFSRLKRQVGKRSGAPGPAGEGDPVLLELMSCATEFKTVTGIRWTAPVDAAESWRRTREWLADSGYAHTDRPPCNS